MNDNYSGQTVIYAGMQGPTLTQIEQFIAGIQAGAFAEYTGTNINEMTVRPSGTEVVGFMESFPNKPLSNWANKFCFDPVSKIISGIGTCEGTVSSLSGRLFSKELLFNLNTNSFTQLWNPTDVPEGHVYDSNPSMPMNGKIYRISYGPNYDIPNFIKISVRNTNGSWQDTGFNLNSLAGGPWGYWFCLEVFPEMGAQGSLLLLEGKTDIARLVRFDIATGQRSIVASLQNIGEYPLMTYVNGSVFLGSGGANKSLYRLTSDGSVSAIINQYPPRLSATSYEKMVACPKGTDHVYTFENDDASVKRINVITGNVENLGAYGLGMSASVNVVATSLRGLGAIAFFDGRGQTAGVTTSKFNIYKVPA